MPHRKTCTKCGESKDLLDFYPRSGRPSFRSDCKACVNARSRNYYRLNSSTVKSKVRSRFYNLPAATIAGMRQRQGDKCAICGVSESESGRTLHVDDDHNCCPGKRSCGKCVRALLCHNCNVGLGAFGDDVSRLRAAIEYLSLANPAQS